MTSRTADKTLRVLLSIASFVFVALSLVVVMLPFWKPLAWAVIVVLTTWPVYTRLRKFIPSPSLSALLMTVLVALTFMAIVVPVVTSLFNETKGALDMIRQQVISTPEASLAKLDSVPVIGEKIKDMIEHFDPTVIERGIQKYREELVLVASSAAKGIFGVLFTFVFSLISMFFLYRDGQNFSAQAQIALRKIAGERVNKVLLALKGTVRGAVYGLLMTAVAQGILAWFSYIIAGAPLPYFLGFATMIASLVPFGTPFIYVPVGLWVMMNSSIGFGLFVIIWGIAVVSLADNFLRPLFISQATELPVLLILMSALGAIISFGLIGLFVGPGIISVVLVLWFEFIEDEKHQLKNQISD